MRDNNRLLTHGGMVQVIWLMGETHEDDEINQKLRFETIAEAQDSKTSRLVAEEIFNGLENYGREENNFGDKYFTISLKDLKHIKSKYGIK